MRDRDEKIYVLRRDTEKLTAKLAQVTADNEMLNKQFTTLDKVRWGFGWGRREKRRQTDRQTDRQDRQTDRHRETDRQRQTERASRPATWCALKCMQGPMTKEVND